MSRLGSAFVEIRPDLSGFERNLAAGIRSAVRRDPEVHIRPDTRDFERNLSAGVLPGIRRVATAAASIFAIGQATAFFRTSIEGASDLAESTSKANVVFGEAAGGVQAFARTAANSLGQSRQQALEAAATFGNLFVALDIGQKPAADMSTRLVTLAGDLASFNNVRPDEALQALRSGLVGETEPLRRFGVNLNQASIEAKALELGLVGTARSSTKVRTAQASVATATERLAKAQKTFGDSSTQAEAARAALAAAEERLGKATAGTAEKLTPAARAQAAYALILDQTKTAQGDFARTSDGLANRQRILAARFADLRAGIGTALLPTAVRFAAFIQDRLFPALGRIGQVIRDVAGRVRSFADIFADAFRNPGVASSGLAGGIEQVAGVARRFVNFVRDDLVPALGRIGEFVRSEVVPAVASGVQAIRPAVEFVIAKVGEMVEFFRRISPQVQEAIGHLVETARALFQVFGDDIARIVSAALGLVRGIIDAALQVIRGVIQTVLAVINGDWSRAWEGLKQVVAGAWEGVKAIVSAGIGAVQGLIGGLANAIAAVAGGIWNPIVSGFKAAINVIIRAWNSLRFTVPGFDPPGPGPTFGGFTVGVPRIAELRERGGPVLAGRAYIVGERRPELFIPDRPGRIEPSVPGAGGGSTQTINNFNQTFNERVEPLHVSAEIAWASGVRR
ncbi:MAG: hypothetical protein M3P85_11140 [Actinomycetota bacterium]|nr:hypothetical protein [Actinomycetota bacterium]